MKAHADTEAEPSLAESESRSIFNVFVTYDGPRSVAQAMETCEYVTRQLGSEFSVHKRVWDFQLLRSQELKEIAAAEAASADMIIFSTSQEAIPTDLASWVEMWKERRAPRTGALVALITEDTESGEPVPSVYHYLADVAQSMQMDFISRPRPSSLTSEHA